MLKLLVMNLGWERINVRVRIISNNFLDTFTSIYHLGVRHFFFGCRP